MVQLMKCNNRHHIADMGHTYLESIREINREGLAGLYETILETAKTEIRLALMVGTHVP